MTARKFALAAINDGGEFEKALHEIYTPELEFKKISHLKATFYDLEPKISDKKFKFDLYDKHDSFLFSIVQTPYLSSNVTRKVFFMTHMLLKFLELAEILLSPLTLNHHVSFLFRELLIKELS